MGVGMADIEYLSDRGHLPAGTASVLDIGSQNLFNITPDAVRRFVTLHRSGEPTAALEAEFERISYFSTPRAGERTTYLSELFDLTPSLFYTSYDVCPALKTEIFDLNSEDLPAAYRNRFDVVLNCGTTEHVINQINSFKVMHDAVKPGGVIFHQVPSIGWLGHGYFTYHKEFFDDLAAANGYEMVDHWLVPERRMEIANADIRDPYKPQIPNSFATKNGLQLTIQCFNISVILRKVRDRPFRVNLELATSHAGLSDTMQSKYTVEPALVASADLVSPSTPPDIHQVPRIAHTAPLDDGRIKPPTQPTKIAAE